MWKYTEVTRRLGLAAPIIQAPFGGGISSVDLVVAVCESGGLGSFGVHHLDANDIGVVARQIRARSARPFALNLWIPLTDSDDPQTEGAALARNTALFQPYSTERGVQATRRPERFSPLYAEQIEAVLAARPAVFSFVFGIPEQSVLRRCRELDIVTIGAVTTVDEAIAMEGAGVDMIVATGFDAGGHCVSFLNGAEESLTGTFSLIPQVVDAVRIPVIAAGGIADARGIAAALTLGAQAVQIGTAFLACDESNTDAIHRGMFFSHKARCTELPPIFDGRSDLMSLWCGQSAPLTKQGDARSLMTTLIDETSSIRLHQVVTAKGATEQIADSRSPPGLTKKEWTVLKLIAAGYTNDEIASGLFVTMATVKTHINHLYSKINVRNRQEAIHVARSL